MAKKWKYIEKSSKALSLSEALSLPPLLINILIHRGYDTEDKIKLFLYGDRSDLSSPFSLINMASGAKRIKEGIENGEKITIYGDYDVDGFCSATLLKRALNHFYDKVEIYIPDRLEEGYGLNEKALNELLEGGTNLVITVDCGVSSTALIEQFKAKGLDFVITDHHQLPEVLPKAIVINPLLERDENAPYRGLSGCGVAFMLALALAHVFEADEKVHEKIFSLVDIAAIATVADVMKLTDDNRIIVKEGIKQIKRHPRTFIQSILDLSNGAIEQFDTEVIGYQIAPRINACGRLNEISLGLSFLLEDDIEKSKQLANKIEDLNQKRKQLADEIWVDAIAQIERENQMSDDAIVVYGDYYQGVIGIVASRLVGQYGVPSIVLGKNEGGYTGSARSIKGCALPDLLASVSSYLTRYGGHAMAAGMSLAEENITGFKSAFKHAVSTLNQAFEEEPLEIAIALNPNQISPRLYDALSLLEPTGHFNPKPILSFNSQKGYQLKACGADKSHLQVSIDGFRGIGFGQAKYLTWFNPQDACDLAFTIKKNFFRGQEKLEFILEDFRPSFLSGHQLDDCLFLEGEQYLVKDNYQDIELQGYFFTKVVGVSFEQRQETIEKLSDDSLITLQREVDNPIDSNAIQVVSDKGVLGYLKKELAKHLAPVIDEGIAYQVASWEKTGTKEKNFGLNLKLQKMTEASLATFEPSKNYTDSEIKSSLLPFGVYSEVQNKALEALRQEKNTLVIMPTGRGKSLIYQTRALELAKANKVTLVIAPLRSLIGDQYLHLKELVSDLGLSIAKVTGDLSWHEKELFLDNYAKHNYDIVFTTPEYLFAHQEVFLTNQLGLLVIDEAHYLSSRRLGYKTLVSLLPKFNCTFLALTATTDEHSYEKLQEVLSGPEVIIDDYVKENQLIIDHRNTQAKLPYLNQLVLQGEKALVYVNSKKQAYEIAKRLREEASYENREKIAYYHSGLPRSTREEVEKRYKNGEYSMLVATSAFGEGINIKDIRHLVFYHLPFSKESFNQIAGRAGRDGKETYIHLLYSHNDESINEKILDFCAPTREMLLDLYLVLRGDSIFHKASPYDTNLFLKALEKKGQYWDKAQVKLGLSIFNELGLILLNQVEGEKLLRLLPQQGKLNLEDSTIFLEGQRERAAFLELKALAFQKNLDLIKALINRVLIPSREEALI